MLPGSMSYPYKNEVRRCGPNKLFVWNNTGALTALNRLDYDFLSQYPDSMLLVDFGNSSAADIQPGNPLWQKMLELTEKYNVFVFQLTLEGGYLPWHGNPDELGRFDAIKIKLKK